MTAMAMTAMAAITASACQPRGGRRLDVAVAIARAAIVVGVMVTAVALWDGVCSMD
jgi:hypothetical protein